MLLKTYVFVYCPSPHQITHSLGVPAIAHAYLHSQLPPEHGFATKHLLGESLASNLSLSLGRLSEGGI